MTDALSAAIATTPPSEPSARRSWRDVIKVHPAADLFPMMPEEELRELGEDIKKNGFVAPIVMWSAGTGFGGPTRQRARYWLLDGRNRLDAAEMAGLKIEYDFERGTVYVADQEVSRTLFAYRSRAGAREKWIDPYEYVVSVNIQRRHLSREQKHELICRLLKADPHKSDRQIAKMVKADRRELERREEIPHVETRTDTSGREQPATKARPDAKEPTALQPQVISEVAKTMLETKSASAEFVAATNLIGAMKRFAQFCRENDPELVAGGLMSGDALEIRQMVSDIRAWLDHFVVNLASPASPRTMKPTALAPLAERIAARFGDGQCHPLWTIADALDLDQTKVTAVLDQMPDGWNHTIKEYSSGLYARIWWEASS